MKPLALLCSLAALAPAPQGISIRTSLPGGGELTVVEVRPQLKEVRPVLSSEMKTTRAIAQDAADAVAALQDLDHQRNVLNVDAWNCALILGGDAALVREKASLHAFSHQEAGPRGLFGLGIDERGTVLANVLLANHAGLVETRHAAAAGVAHLRMKEHDGKRLEFGLTHAPNPPCCVGST